MATLSTLYRHSLTLLTDLYQLTMASGYHKLGMADRRAAFHLYFRKAPFGGRVAVACGLATVLEYLENLRFEPGDLAYLATLTGNDGAPLFEPGFLEHLAGLRLACDVDAVVEGEIVFAQEPLLRVVGPLAHCQLIETALLNMINFQTLVATKSARVCAAAQTDSVLEFGLRRAQGVDGGLSATRAAYVGGCAATSNVLAGKVFGIPVKGTHAHSWIMAFGDEREAFDAYARAMPNNCVFLVDTYDTIEGVRNAVRAGLDLRARGHEMVGIRLDSGDMTALSIEARRILDEGGFPKAAIVASSDLDEHRIREMKQRGARVTVWGVGTRLATCYDQPALGGVYKLAAMQEPDGQWRPRIKLSDMAIKTTIPGRQQVRRYTDEGGRHVADAIVSLEDPPLDGPGVVHPFGRDGAVPLDPGLQYRELLVPVLRGGRRVYDPPPLTDSRAEAMAGYTALSAGDAVIGLEGRLHALRERMINERRDSR